ncbi:MAG: cupin domain-containing protein [Defluviitaleaceae bacterium]|nr:cupin domain-containing protein [Defluviitaleaceae bacterium]
MLTVLTQSPAVRIERIVSTGQTTGWYDQAEAEFVVLLDGRAEIEFENKPSVTMERGDTIIIQPYERHRVTYTSINPPCVWLCVFYRGCGGKPK